MRVGRRTQRLAIRVVYTRPVNICAEFVLPNAPFRMPAEINAQLNHRVQVIKDLSVQVNYYL